MEEDMLTDRELQTMRNLGGFSEDAADEIAALRAQVAALESDIAAEKLFSRQAMQAAQEMSAERDRLREDAGRWRELRRDREVGLICMYFGNGSINKTIAMVEAKIDAALAARKGEA